MRLHVVNDGLYGERNGTAFLDQGRRFEENQVVDIQGLSLWSLHQVIKLFCLCRTALYSSGLPMPTDVELFADPSRQARFLLRRAFQAAISRTTPHDDPTAPNRFCFTHLHVYS